MTNREILLKTISNEFAKWQVQIENLNSLSLYDANIFSEYTLCELLNIAFDYKLINANLISANFPSVDLVDKTNKIAIQVTSTSQRNKIQATLNKFSEKRLYLEYDQIFIIILGKKQKIYSNLSVSPEISFDQSEQILDFKSLLNIIAKLPLKRIEKISSLLNQESIKSYAKRPNSNATILKKKLSLKKRLQKDLLFEVDRKHWEQLRYEPCFKFTYHNVIIRSVDDKSFPGGNDKDKTKMSSWFKGEFWDFYDNGIELISHGGTAIFVNEGYWDILNWREDKREDKREENEKYTKVDYHTFLRIPYEFIVDYDMEPEAYYGLPTIYVEYAKDDMPYEEILFGRGGYYDKQNPKNSYYTYYFEKDKRRKLK